MTRDVDLPADVMAEYERIINGDDPNSGSFSDSSSDDSEEESEEDDEEELEEKRLKAEAQLKLKEA